MGVFRDAMEQAMALRGLAPKTRSAYLGWIRRLVQFTHVIADQLTTEHVRAFLLHLTQERKVSFSTFNQALNAVRFLFHRGAKPPMAGPEEVLRYLGRYTHRIAIGNERLLAQRLTRMAKSASDSRTAAAAAADK